MNSGPTGSMRETSRFIPFIFAYSMVLALEMGFSMGEISSY